MILDLAQGDGFTLRRVASSNGGEYAGPCPRCGGRDRFRVWPKEGRTDGFGVGVAGGPATRSSTFETTGQVLPFSLLGSGKDPGQRPNRAGKMNGACTRPGSSSPQWQPKAAQSVPSGRWQEKARALVEWSSRKLWTRAGAEGQALLSAKGLSPETARRFQLGWIPETYIGDRAGWGMEAKRRDDGRLKKLWLPAGLVIPSYAGPYLVRVKFRP